MYCNQHTSANRVSVVCLTNVHILVLSCVRSELMKMTECAAYGTHQPKEWVLYKCPCVCVLYNSVKSEFMKMTECAAYSTHQPKEWVLYKCPSVCVFYAILLEVIMSWWRWPNVLLMAHINQKSECCTFFKVSVYYTTHWLIMSEPMKMSECAAYGTCTHQSTKWVLSVCSIY